VRADRLDPLFPQLQLFLNRLLQRVLLHRHDVAAAHVEREFLRLGIADRSEAFRDGGSGNTRALVERGQKSVEIFLQFFLAWRGQAETELKTAPDGAVQQLGMVGRRNYDRVTWQ